MKAITDLRDRQQANRNPGAELGTFLIEHSNSLEYLVSQLAAYLAAARLDLRDEKRLLSKLAEGINKRE